MFNQEKIPPANVETDKERSPLQTLRDLAKRLGEMPEHGSSLGVTEMMKLAEDYPDLLDFFENGQNDLIPKEARRLSVLQEKFLLGRLKAGELEELEQFFKNFREAEPGNRRLI